MPFKRVSPSPDWDNPANPRVLPYSWDNPALDQAFWERNFDLRYSWWLLPQIEEACPQCGRLLTARVRVDLGQVPACRHHLTRRQQHRAWLRRGPRLRARLP